MKNTPSKEQIIAKAWKDPAFKQRLLSNPKETLKEVGINIPEHVQVQVIEDQPDTYTFVLPATPANIEGMTEYEFAHIVMAYTESHTCGHCGGCPH